MRFLKGFNWYLLLAIIVICGVVNFSFPVLAIVWTATISVPNPSSTVYTYPQIQVNTNNTQLIAGGFCDADQLDVVITNSTGTSQPMMPTESVTWFTTSQIAGNSYTTFTWSSDNALKASHQIVIGTGGYIWTADAADLEGSNTFELEISGYFDTGAASNRSIMYKDNAIRLYVPSAGNITGELNGGAVAVSAAVATGSHLINFLADGVNLELWVDSVLQSSSALGAVSMNNNANQFYWNYNNALKYINYIKWSN